MHGFIDRGGDNCRVKFSACVSSESLPHKLPPAKRNKTSNCRASPRKQRQGPLKVDCAPRNIICGINCLLKAVNGASVIHESISKILQQPHSLQVPTAQSWASRQKRVVNKCDSCDSESDIVESNRRLSLLLVEYEVRRLCSGADRTLTTENGTPRHFTTSRAVQELADQANVSVQRVETMRRNARPYTHLISHEDGLGFLLMLGCQSRAL